MKTGPKLKTHESISSKQEAKYSKKSLINELREELNPEVNEFTLDGIHFKLSHTPPDNKHESTTGANINLLSKQVNDLHKLTFSCDRELSDDDLKNKMKAQILSQTGKKFK